MAEPVVLGVDSSTQSTKVLAIGVESGTILGEGRAPQSGENVQDPRDWWRGLVTAARGAIPANAEVQAISVGGQQHGFVTLDAFGEPVRPAPLWNNVDSAEDAERLNAEADFAAAVGSRLVASFTISKLSHFARSCPDDLARTVAICLPHDYLNLRLTGTIASDRGEASGSGWWSPAENRDRRDLLALACGEKEAVRLRLPEIRGPEEITGYLTASAAAELGLSGRIRVGPGSGDNPAAAVGIGASSDELVVSLGTSGTAFAVSATPTADETGEVCGFADATGRFLPLACMLNCTRVVQYAADMLGIGLVDALDRAGRIDPGAGGLWMVPYFDGERTPNLPNATGTLLGLTAERMSPDLMLRAAVDGVAAGIAYCVDALARLAVTAGKLTMVGGGAQHPTWQQAIADAVGLPVSVRGGHEHVARGAAIQAAAIVRGETVASLAEKWRPETVVQRTPRPGACSAFRLDERKAMIDSARVT